jgi:alpha-glucosidase
MFEPKTARMTSALKPGSADSAQARWWHDGVLYQIYPRSFADSNGDGIGDLVGIVEHLDHLSWLGVSGIWLNPTMPSPNRDYGYDVADYRGVHPELGTLQDMDRLIREARRRGIRILLDLVPNHTSDCHPWFLDALTGQNARYRDYYVWADPRPDGSPPNNWLSHFGGSAWAWHERTGQYYLHQFLPQQPDLNWWNPQVQREFDEIMHFWLRRGVAGFRIDVAHGMVNDRELRDDPVATELDHPRIREVGRRPVFSMNRPEVHEILQRFRRNVEAFAESIVVGETHVFDLDQLIPYYGDGSDELHLAFNFLFMHCRFDAGELRSVVEAVEAKLPEGAWPVWTGSNHDGGRLTRRWAGGDPAKKRLAVMMLLTLRGTPFLYYGDEIGMDEMATDPNRTLDPVARLTGDPSRNRDPGRLPMQWTSESGAGFTSAETQPWLPIGDTRACNVADQRRDRGSMLRLTRDLITLRRGRQDLIRGAYRTLPSPESTWVWRRGEETLVALNFSDAAVDVQEAGQILIGTDRRRDGEPFDGGLGPWEGVVVHVP